MKHPRIRLMVAAFALALGLLAAPKAYPTDIPVMDGAGLTVTAELTKPGTVRVDRDDIDRSTAPDLVSQKPPASV